MFEYTIYCEKRVAIGRTDWDRKWIRNFVAIFASTASLHKIKIIFGLICSMLPEYAKIFLCLALVGECRALCVCKIVNSVSDYSMFILHCVSMFCASRCYIWIVIYAQYLLLLLLLFSIFHPKILLHFGCVFGFSLCAFVQWALVMLLLLLFCQAFTSDFGFSYFCFSVHCAIGWYMTLVCRHLYVVFIHSVCRTAMRVYTIKLCTMYPSMSVTSLAKQDRNSVGLLLLWLGKLWMYYNKSDFWYSNKKRQKTYSLCASFQQEPYHRHRLLFTTTKTQNTI